MNQNTTAHTLKAFTKEGDFVPTLYIKGDITTDGQKPVVSLKESLPQGTVKEDLLLEFTIDVYDPKGISQLSIENYERILASSDEFSSVTIQCGNGPIHLSITEQPRN